MADAYETAVLELDGLMHHWPLGADLTASHGGINMTRAGGQPSASMGPLGGRSSYFDGTDDYLYSASSIDLSSTNKITVLAWIKPLTYDTTNDDVLLEFSANYGVNNGSFILKTAGSVANDPIVCATSDGVSENASRYNIANNYPSSTRWRHFAMTIDRTTAQCCNLFLDGRARTASSTTLNAMAGNFGNYTLYVASRAGSSLFANSEKRHLSIVNGILAESEIRALYEKSYEANDLRYEKYARSMSGLAGLWTLNNNYHDEIDSNDLELQGGAAIWQEGKIGPGSWRSAGFNDYYLRSKSTIDLTHTNKATFVFWIDWTVATPAATAEIAIAHGTVNPAIWLGVNTSLSVGQQLITTVLGGIGYNRCEHNEALLFKHGWKHVAVVFDLSSSGKESTLYIDGSAVTSVLGLNANNVNNLGNSYLFVAGTSANPNAIGAGFDTLMVFDVALSAGEIATLYAKEAAKKIKVIPI